MLHRAGADRGDATAALAASSGLQLATTMSLPLIALRAILAGAPVGRGLATAAYLGVAVLVLLIGAGTLVFASDRPLAFAGGLAQRLLNATVRRANPLTGLPQQVPADRDFVRSTLGKHWRGGVLAAAGNTGLDYLALMAALRAVGADPRPSLVLLAYTAAELLALVPLTPGVWVPVIPISRFGALAVRGWVG